MVTAQPDKIKEVQQVTQLEDLQKRMSAAIASNDVKAIEAVAQEIVKSKTDRAKTEALKLQEEATKLAGVREALGIEIHKAVKAMGLDAKLTGVKAWGFTYKVDNANPAEPDVTYKAVALSTQQVKTRSGGTGGSGKTRDEFGMSLSDIFDKFATDDDRAALAEATVKDDKIKVETGKSNRGNEYNVRKDVKKRALAAGLLAPTK